MLSISLSPYLHTRVRLCECVCLHFRGWVKITEHSESSKQYNFPIVGYKILCTGVYTVYKPTPLFGPQTVQRGGGGGGLYSVVYGMCIYMIVSRKFIRAHIAFVCTL